MTNRPCRRRACLTALLVGLAAPAAAQAPDAGMPRVVYGTPSPQVLYGNPSTPAPMPEPRRTAPPPAPVAPQQPQSSLTFQSGPAYVPPQAYWGAPPYWGGQPGWDDRPRPVRPAPPNPPRYVSPERGRFEQPLPQGRYVGRPPSAPLERPFQPRPWDASPERPVYGRPPGP
jgi:translation initiation factor IF-2